jgi:hypothetical protein
MGSTSRISGTLVARVPESIAWVEVDGEAVLYNELRQIVHVLSPTAMLILSGIDGRTSLERIARDLSDAFGTDLDVVRTDVLSLAKELMQQGLIAEAGSGRGAKPHRGRGVGTGSRSDGSRRKPRFLQEPPSG